ncbi:DnaJ-domain-containing protein [Trametopsis cervina]|nr:DnaJ-domain-containing protein [Trametopsis cervina]
MASTVSLYDILGVEQTAPPEALRKAWKRRVLETHPDKLPPDISDEERRLTESRFHEVHQAFEILNDPAKRRVYDNGLNYLRGRLRRSETQERLARTREEWDRQCKLRQEERLRALKEQQAKAREERERLRQEKLQQQWAERPPDDYEEKKRALEEEIRASRERYQENILKAEMKYRERIKQLEEDLNSRKQQLRLAEPLPRIPNKSAHGAFALATDLLQADALLQELRKANPEWEVRRQAALRRKAERTNSAETI